MKSKQLANVLIKILGLSILVHDAPGFITVLFSPPANALVLAVSAALGVFLMVKSRDIAEFLFKTDDE